MSMLAVTAAFTAGLITSVGPCVAPRYLALTAIVARATGRARWVRIGCFVAGLLACYAILATTASLIGNIAAWSRIIYLVLAASFFTFGMRALIARQACRHAVHVRPSGGVAVISGGALGLVFSPCCSPVLAMMASVGGSSGSLTASLTGALAFAAGHLAPLMTIGLGLGVTERVAGTRAVSDAGATISGGLSLALAAYYGLLA
ncbi:MAG: cytochrome c biogenesis protein CcdA [Candidatus Aquilonibacter sp.]